MPQSIDGSIVNPCKVLQPGTALAVVSSWMEETPESVAHSLIASHGPAALGVAERAAKNVRQVGMQDKAEKWNRVVAAVKKKLEGGDA
jgi:hypothetical protein